ncbi:hypothetical protein IU483_17845 [Streptomyces gardneri]|nr:hypothetical protein [Streptomyces gardneri]
MADNEVDEIGRDTARFGRSVAALLEFIIQWRRANPKATSLPRSVRKEINRRLREERRADVLKQARQRQLVRTTVEQRVALHRGHAAAWRTQSGPSPEAYSRQQWALVREREQIARFIHSAPGLSAVERGQAVTALTAAHYADNPNVRQRPIWLSRASLAPTGLDALRARAADRLSRIQLGITERGRGRQRDRQIPVETQRKNTMDRTNEIRRLNAYVQRMNAERDAFAKKLNGQGRSLESWTPKAAQLREDFDANLQEIGARIDSLIESSGLDYDQWRSAVASMDEIPPAEEIRAERMSLWELERDYRMDADPDLPRRLREDPERGRFWDHYFPDRDAALYREFNNLPAGWQPRGAGSLDRYVVQLSVIDSNERPHFQIANTPEQAYDWAANKAYWLTGGHGERGVAVTVWDRSIPLEDGRIPEAALERFAGRSGAVQQQLHERFDLERERSRRGERPMPDVQGPDAPERADITAVATPDRDRPQPRAAGDWTAEEAVWFGQVTNRDQLRETFGRIERRGVSDIEEWGWSEDLERVRFAIDKRGIMTSEEADRARVMLAKFETDARAGRRTDEALWEKLTQPQTPARPLSQRDRPEPGALDADDLHGQLAQSREDYDRLWSEVEGLRNDVDSYRGLDKTRTATIAQLREQVNTLTQERDALRRDRERGGAERDRSADAVDWVQDEFGTPTTAATAPPEHERLREELVERVTQQDQRLAALNETMQRLGVPEEMRNGVISVFEPPEEARRLAGQAETFVSSSRSAPDIEVPGIPDFDR